MQPNLSHRNGAARGATIGCSATLDDAPDAQCCSSLDTVVLLLSRRLSVVPAGFRRQLDIYPRGAVNLVHALSDDGRRQVGVLLSALSAGLAGRRAKGCKLVTRVVDGRVQGAMVTCAALFRTASYRGGFQPGRRKVDPAGTDGDAGTPAVRVPTHQFYRGVRGPPNDCSMAVSWESGD